MIKDQKNLWRDLFKIASDNVKRGESGSTGCADGVFSRVRTDESVLSQNTLSANASIQPIMGANGKRVSVSSKKKKEKEIAKNKLDEEGGGLAFGSLEFFGNDL